MHTSHTVPSPARLQGSGAVFPTPSLHSRNGTAVTGSLEHVYDCACNVRHPEPPRMQHQYLCCSLAVLACVCFW